MDIIDAIRTHDLEALQTCLFQGQNPNQVDDYYKITPLHYAVVYQFPEAVAPLLEAGTDPTARIIDGDTPAMLAYKEDLLSLVVLLS